MNLMFIHHIEMNVKKLILIGMLHVLVYIIKVGSYLHTHATTKKTRAAQIAIECHVNNSCGLKAF